MSSERNKRFEQVSKIVHKHIQEYTIPRYGDFPEDRLAEMTIADCQNDIKKYCARFTAPERYPDERLHDLIKIIHLAAETYLKMEG